MSEILSYPSKWQVRRLEEVAANSQYPIGDGDHGQIKPKDYATEGIPYIRVGDMGWGQFLPEKMVYIPEEVHLKNLKSKLLPGDILIAKTGATIGKCCIIPDTIKEANTTSSVGKITVDKNKILPEWVLHWFLTPNFLKFIWSISNRAAQPGFNNRDIKLFKIPVPPLPEQKRILVILNDALAKIEKAKANAEQNLKNAKELFESYLQGVFEDKGDDWEEKTLGEVCKISSKLIDPKISEYQNLIHIGAGNVESKKGTLIDLKTAKEENLISGKFLFDESMILYSKIRPYLMKVVNCEFQGLCSADIYPLVPIKEKMTKDFLYHLLLTKDFTDYAILGSQRAGMPKVNREHLFAYKFELPPIKEQKTIVQKLDGLSADIKKLEEVYKQKICDLEELKKSVLQKAFSGEL